jgi:hypothetical protein
MQSEAQFILKTLVLVQDILFTSYNSFIKCLLKDEKLGWGWEYTLIKDTDIPLIQCLTVSNWTLGGMDNYQKTMYLFQNFSQPVKHT